MPGVPDAPHALITKAVEVHCIMGNEAIQEVYWRRVSRDEYRRNQEDDGGNVLFYVPASDQFKPEAPYETRFMPERLRFTLAGQLGGALLLSGGDQSEHGCQLMLEATTAR